MVQMCQIAQYDAEKAQPFEYNGRVVSATIMVPLKKNADDICVALFKTSCDLKKIVKRKAKISLRCDKIEDYIGIFWETFTGTIFGGYALKALAPAALSLIPGIAKGALVSKFMLPNSSYTGYILMSKPFLYTPLVLALCIAIFQILGDLFFSLGLLCLTMGQAGIAVFGQGTTQSVELWELQRAVNRMNIQVKISFVLALTFFLLSLFTRRDTLDYISDLGLAVAAYDIPPGNIFFKTKLAVSSFESIYKT